MRSNNDNEAITHLAMPERQIPVLIDSSPENAEGFVPSSGTSDLSVTMVRRLLPSFVDGLRNPQRRKEIEREHGAIDAAEWNRLREMLALKDRLNADDWGPGLFLYGEEQERRFVVRGSVKGAGFLLLKAFTAGLSKTRFVVWWHKAAKKFVPGLYCPDIVTALYALAVWSSGTAGGWAICQKCGNDYPRRRAKQRYCSHKCQVAAAMQRYRANLERKAKAKSKTTTKGKKQAGRK